MSSNNINLQTCHASLYRFKQKIAWSPDDNQPVTEE